MKDFIHGLSTKVVYYAVIVALTLLWANSLVAQPTNYCRPWCPDGYTYCYCYSQSAYFTEVRINKVSDGEVVLQRSSGTEPNCYTFVNDREGRLEPGEEYNLYIRAYSYYAGCFIRAYIDWNIDGDFYDTGLYTSPTVNEDIFGGSVSTSVSFAESEITFKFKVPTDVETGVEEGRTRLRLLTSYAYDPSNPCCIGYCYSTYQVAYGEGEDYIVKFEGGVKDTYPTQNDILYANELYDGTSRMKNGVMVEFKKPALLFSSNQPAGVQCRYKIMGPLPSTQVVYEALDPNTGLPEIDVAGYNNYPIQAAHGKCAVGIYGDFKSSQGGTYKVYAFMLGKPKELIQTFTVAWENDLSVAGIVSPKINVAPKFFKYLRGQTIKVTGLFQNVGLADVYEFDCFAKIWNSAGELIYRDSTRYSSPPKEVMPIGKSVEVDFRNVRFKM